MEKVNWTWIAVGLMVGTLLVSVAFYYLGIGAFFLVLIFPFWGFWRKK